MKDFNNDWLLRSYGVLAYKKRNIAPLTKKVIRYAMIKGWAERKHPELKPWYCKPDPTLVNLMYEFD
jgi:hypothetical protein